MKKKIIAVLLTAAMLLQMCAVLAAEDGAEIPVEDGQTVVYNGQPQRPEAAADEDMLDWSQEPVDAGTYEIQVSGLPGGPYDGAVKTVSFTIEPAPVGLDPVFPFMVDKKIYDGTTSASGMVCVDMTEDGCFPEAEATFTFADPEAGPEKELLVTDIHLTEAWQGNYVLTAEPDYTLTASIEPRHCAVEVEGELDQEPGQGLPLTVRVTPEGMPEIMLLEGEEGPAADPIAYTLSYDGQPQEAGEDGTFPPPAGEGSYAVLAQVTDPNYEGQAIQTLNIGAPLADEDPILDGIVEDDKLADALFQVFDLLDWDESDPKPTTKEDITSKHIDRIGVLTVEGPANLAGLEHAKGLRSLTVTGGELADLTPIAGLPNLESLSVTGTKIAALPQLGTEGGWGRRHFQELDLRHNKELTDISGVSVLGELKKADFSGCAKLGDVSALGACEKLVVLDLSDSAATNLDGLPKSLGRLTLSGCGELSDLTGLPTALVALTAEGVPLSKASLELLSSRALESLNINGFNGEVSGDEALTILLGEPGAPTELAKHLSWLQMSDCGLTTLAPVGNAAGLTTLLVNGNSLSDRAAVQPALDLVGLKYLYLEDNHIDDLSVLDAIYQKAESMGERAGDLTVRLDHNKLNLAVYAKNRLEAISLLGCHITAEGQLPDPDAPIAPPTQAGEYRLTAVLQAPVASTPGAVVNAKLVCTNDGETAVPRGAIFCIGSEGLGDETREEAYLKLDKPLEPGESVSLPISFTVPVDIKADRIVLTGVLKLPAEGEEGPERAPIAESIVKVVKVTMNVPAVLGSQKSFQIYGEIPMWKEKLEGVRLRYSETNGNDWTYVGAGGEKEPVSVDKTEITGNWYTMTVTWKEPAEKTLYLQVEAKYGENQYYSVPAAVGYSPDYLSVEDIYVRSGSQLYRKNDKTGVPTFSAWTNTRLIGSDLTPYLKLSRSEGVSVTFSFGGKTVAAECNDYGYFTATLSGWSDVGVRPIVANVADGDGRRYSFTIAQVTILIDPSGVIRDEAGPVEGAVATLYQRTGSGWEESDWELWDAEAHMQVNPQTTGADGAYGWMVPEGIYKVEVTARGYDDAVRGDKPDDIIQIPPVRTDVDFELEKLPDVKSLGEVKAAVTEALDQFVFTADTRADEVLAAAKAALPAPGADLDWSEVDGFRVVAPRARSARAGGLRVTGTLVLTEGGSSLLIVLDKTTAVYQSLEEAKTAVAEWVKTYTATNETTGDGMLEDLRASGKIVNQGIHVSWKDFVLSPSTTEAAGHVSVILVLTLDRKTAKVAVDRPIAQLPEDTSEQTLAQAKTAVEAWLERYAVSNATTKEAMLVDIKLSEALKDTGIEAAWKDFTLTKATAAAPGKVAGTLVLTLNGKTVDLEVERPIDKIPEDPDEKALAQAKTAVQNWCASYAVSNSTTAKGVLDALTASGTVKDGKIGAAWSTEQGKGFVLTKATTSAAGTVKGTLVLTRNGKTVEIAVERTIDKLSNGGGGGGGGGGSSSRPKPDTSSKEEAGAKEDQKPKLTLPALQPKAEGTARFQAFTDLDGHWAREEIRYVTERGLFQGMTDTAFEPQRGMSRAMAVTVLFRMAGAPEGSASAGFTDVAAGQWYAGAVDWAAAQGISQGTGGGFAPDAQITREQLAVMLYQFAGYAGLDRETAGEKEVKDASAVSAWAAEAMAWAVDKEVLQGDADGSLRPGDPVSRAETAAMLYRFVGLI